MTSNEKSVLCNNVSRMAVEMLSISVGKPSWYRWNAICNKSDDLWMKVEAEWEEEQKAFPWYASIQEVLNSVF